MTYKLLNQQYLVKMTVYYITRCYLYHIWKDQLTLLHDYIEPFMKHKMNIRDSFKSCNFAEGKLWDKKINFFLEYFDT